MNGTVERAPAAVRRYGPVRVGLDPLTWRSAVYLLAHWPIGLAYGVALVVLVSVGAGTIVIWVGIPLLALTMVLWRGAAVLERQLARLAFGTEISSPYRQMPSGNVFRKWKALTLDPATWKDLVYLVLAFPIGLAEFVALVVPFSMAVALFISPLLVLGNNGGHVWISLGDSRFQVDEWWKAIVAVPFGLIPLMVGIYLSRGLGYAHGLYARYLLGPSENQQLRRRAAQLQASRARGVDAAEAERRRIERDLHDGAQQQLLAVAMDLGRARAKLDTDLAAAQDLIMQAHQGAKDAIVELRNLARGIYPAILTDRGLDAAVSALAARVEVPIDVDVDLPDRPPAAVESIAYFIVAEALTNITKYARATRAAVRVSREQNWVVVEVSDNGVGGADATAGGGLSGLADRAAGIDGILTVNSPLGGPTVVRADLPCVW